MNLVIFHLLLVFCGQEAFWALGWVWSKFWVWGGVFEMEWTRRGSDQTAILPHPSMWSVLLSMPKCPTSIECSWMLLDALGLSFKWCLRYSDKIFLQFTSTLEVSLFKWSVESTSTSRNLEIILNNLKLERSTIYVVEHPTTFTTTKSKKT